MKELTRMDKDERKAEFIRLFNANNTKYFKTQFSIYFALNGKYKPSLEFGVYPIWLGEKGFRNAKTKLEGYLSLNSGRSPSVFAIQMLIDFIEELKK